MSTVSPLRRLTQYGAHYKLQILLATTCSILNKICDLTPEILIGIAIDIIVNQGHSKMAHLTQITSPFTQLYVIGALTAFFWIGESVFEYLYAVLWRDIARKIQHHLRLQAYGHLQALDMAFFEDKTTGGLLAVVNEDVNNLEDFLVMAPNELLQLITNVLVMGSIFVYLAPAIALCTLLPVPFVVLIARYFQHQLAAHYARARQQLAVLTTHLTSRINGIVNIKSYVTENYEYQQIARESNHYQQALQAA
ncbi:MAG TPA: ABC transporter transmembrane domain-containing protein, partial [Candidatus Babeliales bacterium]|nr:ABC transporter transmembrane domain-containing protein [Candidatus Babeliales bacterium]